MGVFYHEEPPNHPKRCKYLVATFIKEVFSSCQSFAARLSTSSFEDECPVSDFDEKQEVSISIFLKNYEILTFDCIKECLVVHVM